MVATPPFQTQAHVSHLSWKMKQLHIYGLFTRMLDGTKCYFYVGKTDRSVELRIAEHRRGTGARQEDLYRYLRYLLEREIAWEYEVLQRCVDERSARSAEYWQVAKLLRGKHNLRNMRYGDRFGSRFLQSILTDETIQTEDGVTRARVAFVRALIHGRMQRRARHRRRLQHREFIDTLARYGIRSIDDCPLVVLASRLKAHGVTSIKKGVDLKDVVEVARDQRTWRMLRQIASNADKHTPPIVKRSPA